MRTNWAWMWTYSAWSQHKKPERLNAFISRPRGIQPEADGERFTVLISPTCTIDASIPHGGSHSSALQRPKTTFGSGCDPLEELLCWAAPPAASGVWPRLLSHREASKTWLSQHHVCGVEEQLKAILRTFFTITEGTGCYQWTNTQDKKKMGPIWFQYTGKKLLGGLEYLWKFLFNG